jgi:alcohol dehydrogenase class IV
MAPTNALTLKSLRINANDSVHTPLTKYTKLGKIFSDQKNNTDAWYQDYFIEELERLATQLDIPKLSEYGVRTTDIKDIVGKTGNKYNPAQLTEEELANILRCRISS